MTSPPEQITIECPRCGHHYDSWWRPSLNLKLDHFTEPELAAATSATCPACTHTVQLDTLIVRANSTR